MDFKTVLESNYNPDEIRQMDSRTFLIYDNFLAYYKTNRNRIHLELIEVLKDIFIKPSLGPDDMNKEDVHYEGDLPEKMEEYLLERAVGRGPFLSAGGILGRISLREKIIAFWNKKSDFKENEKKAVLRIFEIFGQNPQEYWFTFQTGRGYMHCEKLSYEQFFNNAAKFSDSFKKPSRDDVEKQRLAELDKVLHLASPEEKGQMMKDAGIKPKPALGAVQRFAMGEQLEFKDFVPLA